MSEESVRGIVPEEPRAAMREEHMFRAAPMTLVQMYISQEISRDAVGQLGSLGCVHFQDLNANVSAFNRLFVPELRRIDVMIRNIRQLEKLCFGSSQHNDPLDQDLLDEPLVPSVKVEEMSEIIATEAEKLSSLSASFAKLTSKRDELLEERLILQKSRQFFGTSRVKSAAAVNETDEAPLLDSYVDDDATEFDIDEEDPLSRSYSGSDPTDERGHDGNYRYQSPVLPYFNQDILAGSIDRTRSLALERLCWRVTRGNLVFNRYPVETTSPEETKKDIFMVYTHGSQIRQRVLRICESLEARIISVNAATREERLTIVNDRLNELFTVLQQTEGTLQLEQELAAGKLPLWKVVAVKERALYETLNLFSSDHGRQGLIGEGWVLSDRLPEVQDLMMAISQSTSQLAVINTIKTNRAPPTYHTTNKVTAGFQAMVDIYGIARHGEVNPGLPTTVTFPFLFAVMFGDVGHGFILFLGAFSLVWSEAKIARQKNRDELFDMAYMGRYVLLFMGLFSIFTGFIYNDIFSRSMTIFSSGWEYEKSGDATSGSFTSSRVGRYVYPFGIDWAWHGAENNLRFTNSYKMKLSVLLGFAHMTYSLMFQYVNAKYFNSWIDVWGNFVPSFLFMQSIFGYLSLTIVYKWCVDWIGQNKEPPGLLDMLIKMFLSPGTIDPPLYKGQAVVQIALLLLALVCVPWLLLFKPLYLRRRLKLQGNLYDTMRLDEHTFAIDEDDGNTLEVDDTFAVDDSANDRFEVSDSDAGVDHEHESFGDIMIHQVIHTIEFCLNCVSHTASYLRLWALSLAHSQLSIVLWNMTLQNAFGPTGAKGIIMVVCLFAMWFVITVLVLVCMEGTSAMLHALRLQWVEAMSKHFEGEGYAFNPLDLHALES